MASIALGSCAEPQPVPASPPMPEAAAPAPELPPVADAGPAPAPLQPVPPEPPKVVACDFSPILFASNSSHLDPTARTHTESLATCLKGESGRLALSGYADGSGESAYNLKLSLARAESVKAYLVELGVDGARLIVVGRGEAAPIAGDAAASRRVEFVVPKAP